MSSIDRKKIRTGKPLGHCTAMIPAVVVGMGYNSLVFLNESMDTEYKAIELDMNPDCIVQHKQSGHLVVGLSKITEMERSTGAVRVYNIDGKLVCE